MTKHPIRNTNFYIKQASRMSWVAKGYARSLAAELRVD